MFLLHLSYGTVKGEDKVLLEVDTYINTGLAEDIPLDMGDLRIGEFHLLGDADIVLEEELVHPKNIIEGFLKAFFLRVTYQLYPFGSIGNDHREGSSLRIVLRIDMPLRGYLPLKGQ